MTEFLMGALGALAVLTLLAGGFLLGWKAAGGKSRHRSAAVEQEAGLEERRRMLEEQKAFREMLNYNQIVMVIDKAMSYTKGGTDKCLFPD